MLAINCVITMQDRGTSGEQPGNNNSIIKGYKMMNVIKLLMILSAIILTVEVTSVVALAGDLDDGISTYKDESIEDDGELGDADININFIVLDAISSAKMKKDDKNININDGSGDSNKNSVVCEVGAECGSIINIDLD